MNTIKQHKQRRHIARSARRLSCAGAVAILLTWAPASIAAAEDEPAPGSEQSQAAPSVQKSDADKLRYPDRTLCAEAQESERSGETVDTLGCGLSIRFADATPAGKHSAQGVEN
ncbi:MAG TPA: hypothetical protein VMP00_17105, partial [Burkholderiales bacterium]|nr:hypothetical protein [Burkholderiales bacterium]